MIGDTGSGESGKYTGVGIAGARASGKRIWNYQLWIHIKSL
jgi:hypothetical protein